MALLLPTVTVTRTRPVPVEDDHGWVTTEEDPEATPLTFAANLQEDEAAAYVTANESGGAGPQDPRVVRAANVYCDPDVDVAVGDLLTIDGDGWRVRSVRLIRDPADLGNDCLVCAVSL